jgi:hypothetical protein
MRMREYAFSAAAWEKLVYLLPIPGMSPGHSEIMSPGVPT